MTLIEIIADMSMAIEVFFCYTHAGKGFFHNLLLGSNSGTKICYCFKIITV